MLHNVSVESFFKLSQFFLFFLYIANTIE